MSILKNKKSEKFEIKLLTCLKNILNYDFFLIGGCNGHKIITLIEQLSWYDFFEDASWCFSEAQQSFQKVDSIQNLEVEFVF